MHPESSSSVSSLGSSHFKLIWVYFVNSTSASCSVSVILSISFPRVVGVYEFLIPMPRSSSLEVPSTCSLRPSLLSSGTAGTSPGWGALTHQVPGQGSVSTLPGTLAAFFSLGLVAPWPGSAFVGGAQGLSCLADPGVSPSALCCRAEVWGEEAGLFGPLFSASLPYPHLLSLKTFCLPSSFCLRRCICDRKFLSPEVLGFWSISHCLLVLGLLVTFPLPHQSLRPPYFPCLCTAATTQRRNSLCLLLRHLLVVVFSRVFCKRCLMATDVVRGKIPQSKIKFDHLLCLPLLILCFGLDHKAYSCFYVLLLSLYLFGYNCLNFLHIHWWFISFILRIVFLCPLLIWGNGGRLDFF